MEASRPGFGHYHRSYDELAGAAHHQSPERFAGEDKRRFVASLIKPFTPCALDH